MEHAFADTPANLSGHRSLLPRILRSLLLTALLPLVSRGLKLGLVSSVPLSPLLNLELSGNPIKMDRPTTARGRETRATIIETAATLMYRRGVRATSLDDVLHEAGCGKSQLYHYFSGRADLLVAVVDHQLQGILANQATFRLDTWSGLRAWFESLVERQQGQDYCGCPLGSLVAELLAEDDSLRDVVAGAFARWQQELTLAFARMRETGRLAPSARPDQLARHVMSAIQGGYLLSTIHRHPEAMREALNAAFEHARESRQARDLRSC